VLKKEAAEAKGEALLFDTILDATGEAMRCVELVKRGGGLVSILAGTTDAAVRRWMAEAEVHAVHMNFTEAEFRPIYS
jgi:hypothetical protein